MIRTIRAHIDSLDHVADGFHSKADYLYSEVMAMLVLGFLLALALSWVLLGLFEAASRVYGLRMHALWGDSLIASAFPALIFSFIVTFVARKNPCLINYSSKRPHRFHRF